jgi:anion-transporting  ArsA/GET3 family ATPase
MTRAGSSRLDTPIRSAFAAGGDDTAATRRPTAHTIEAILRKQLVICVGCGGVGKTTTAAALALAGALHQRRAGVITVDPARRLKDALGLDGLSVEPHRVVVHGGEFDALALDTKRTFDAIIQRFAPSQETAQRILANRLYQEISTGLGGSAEYMAMEKLHELLGGRRYDLLVVDTPPSTHARDLLAAPSRLVNLLASRAVSFLQAPATILGVANSAVGRFTLSALLKALQRWTGLDLLRDLADFVSSFEEMIEGFSRRAEEVSTLLRGRRTAFVLVTTPEPHTIETTIAFHRELVGGGFPVAGIIANRVFAFPRLRDPQAVGAGWAEPLRSKLLRTYGELHALARRDRRALQHLHARLLLPL